MPDDCPHTRAVIEQGIADRLHLGAQLYLSLPGKVLADMSIGESRPGVPMTTDTVNLWMSSGKPITAVAIAQLWERGLLDFDDTVAKHIPEFGVRGKEAITVRHLLTHTGGFRGVIGLKWNEPFDQAIAMICQAPLEPRWIIGQTAGYHLASSWYILAEIVRRRDGRPIDRYAREAIFQPLGMEDSWLGMPAEVYERYGDRIGLMFDTHSPRLLQLAGRGNSQSDAEVVNPGANCRGPIRDLARFYEALRDGAAGRSGPILKPQTIEMMIARHRAGTFDLTFKHTMDWGLGFLLNSNQYGAETVPYGYGRHASPRTFGHSGQQSSCAFCDPAIGLVAAWVCNGMAGEGRSSERQRQINSAVYLDVGVA